MAKLRVESAEENENSLEFYEGQLIGTMTLGKYLAVPKNRHA